MEKKKSYVTFTRDFAGYKWFKPLLVLLLTLLFEVILSSIFVVIYLIIKANQGIGIMDAVAIITGGYDTMDVYSFEGALYSLGSIAAFIPAIWLASKIVKDRPFSSYGSISGGFDIKLFLKFILVALVPIGIPVAVSALLGAERLGAMQFTVLGLIACIILTPLQCIAEEYLFRGLIMQTIGGWFRIPVLAIILQAAVFASQHPYNIYGVLEVFLAGVLMALTVYFTDGLEAASAAHFVNNFTLFFINGLGFKTITADAELSSLIESVVIDSLFLIVVIFLVKKKNFIKRPELVMPESASAPEAVSVADINNGSNEA